MNFQPSDYLADLNLEFDGSTMSPVEEVNKADLDLFTQTEFFDLDVFSSDFVPETKEQQQLAHQHQLQVPVSPQQQRGYPATFPAPQIKRESQESVSQSAIDSECVVTDFTDLSPSSPYVASSNLATSNMTKEELNEIKRKRNTAASARFRIKKKLKEKQMEQQATELRDRLAFLEKRLKTLEMENKCLKQLMIEKNEKKNSDLLESIKKRSLGGELL